jgi:predicted helicase
VLCNVGTIKEGVDLPCIDMLAFCDDKQSRVEIVQCLGRGLRVFLDKPDCLVCCCIPIHSESVQSETDFQTIRHVLTALKSIDSRIEEVLNGKRSSLKVLYKKHKGNTLSCETFVKLMNVGVNSKMSYD